MRNIDVNKLADWIAELKEAAKNDEYFSIAWYSETEEDHFSIIGGWSEYFGSSNPDNADLFCLSKTEPKYAMCIKIAVNNGPYAYTDFDIMDQPIDQHGDVYDTCIVLEWDDSPIAAAQFFKSEWEQLMSGVIAYKDC